MENNAQRFKGTDFVAENSTYQPNQPQLNFNSEEYYYSNASLPFQNYQNPYRSPYEASSNYEPSTYEHAYERPPNPYSASPQAIIPSYQENYQNYGELQATAPHYESFYPEGERNPYYNPNFTPPNYTRTEMSAQNYYQGAAHDIYAANVHGYNSASFQSTPDGNSYRFRQNINITHPNTKPNKINRPTLMADNLKHSLFNSKKLHSTPTNHQINQKIPDTSITAQTIPALSFNPQPLNIKTPNAVYLTSQNTSSNAAVEKLSINITDIPIQGRVQQVIPKSKNIPTSYSLTVKELPTIVHCTSISSTIMKSSGIVSSKSVPDIADFCKNCDTIDSPNLKAPIHNLKELSIILNNTYSMGRDDINSTLTRQDLYPLKNTRSTEQDYPVPSEYLMYQSIREKISNVSCKVFNDDLLFYIYYTMEDDIIKMCAIANLCFKKWRYNTRTKTWIKLPPNYSSGDSYNFFDPLHWEYVSTNRYVDVKNLENISYHKYLDYEGTVVTAQNNMLNNIKPQSSQNINTPASSRINISSPNHT